MSDETPVTLKQTKGSFELRGKLFGLRAEKAYKETTTKNGKPMRFLNFGVRVSATENVYLSLSAMEPDEVYFSKVGKKGDKPITEKFDYAKAKRNDFERDGWKLIGMGLALHKNEEGTKNEDVKVYPQYDAIEEIMDSNLDGVSVFVKGTVEFGSYEDETTKEVKKTQKYVPNAIYLAKTDIDFEDEKFEKYAEFVQPIIYIDAVKTVAEDKSVSCHLVAASINYKDYQEFTLPCTEAIARLFKEKKLKSYCKINVTGHLQNDQIVEIVEEDDSWGEKSKMGKAKNFAKTILMVTGADKDSVNTEDYNVKSIEAFRAEVEAEKATKKNKSAGAETQEGGDWGKKGKVKSEDESGW